MRNARGGCLESTPTPNQPHLFYRRHSLRPASNRIRRALRLVRFNFFAHIQHSGGGLCSTRKCSGTWKDRGTGDCRFTCMSYAGQRDRVISGLDRRAFQALFSCLVSWWCFFLFFSIACVAFVRSISPAPLCCMHLEMGAGAGPGGGKQMIIDYSAFFVSFFLQILGHQGAQKRWSWTGADRRWREGWMGIYLGWRRHRNLPLTTKGYMWRTRGKWW